MTGRVRSAVDPSLVHTGRGEAMKPLSELKVKIFSDGADGASMLELYRHPLIKGLG